MAQHRWNYVRSIRSTFELPQHAGLSSDGKYFFIAEHDDWAYTVIDIATGETIWQVQRTLDYPPLQEWVENGHIEIIEGPATGRYRIFGLEENYPLEVDEVFEIAFEIASASRQLTLVDLQTRQEYDWLTYEMLADQPGGWTIASFSDDGSTIAVFAGPCATFFRLDGLPHTQIQSTLNKYVPEMWPEAMWVQIGIVKGVYEYPQHGGLSADGRLFMLVEYTGTDYLVIDVATQKKIWQSTLPVLSEWIRDDHVRIDEGPAVGLYRIFGLSEGSPLLVHPRTGLSLELDLEDSQLILRDPVTIQEAQRLDYAPSEDWTFASFSDDGSVIAVLANHAVTFFAPASSSFGGDKTTN